LRQLVQGTGKTDEAPLVGIEPRKGRDRGRDSEAGKAQLLTKRDDTRHELKGYQSWAPAGILARGGKVYHLPFLSLPSPVSPFFSSPSLLPCPLLPFLRYCDPFNTAKNLWERCKLPQCGLGQSCGRNSNLGIF